MEGQVPLDQFVIIERTVAQMAQDLFSLVPQAAAAVHCSQPSMAIHALSTSLVPTLSSAAAHGKKEPVDVSTLPSDGVSSFPTAPGTRSKLPVLSQIPTPSVGLPASPTSTVFGNECATHLVLPSCPPRQTLPGSSWTILTERFVSCNLLLLSSFSFISVSFHSFYAAFTFLCTVICTTGTRKCNLSSLLHTLNDFGLLELMVWEE